MSVSALTPFVHTTVTYIFATEMKLASFVSFESQLNSHLHRDCPK